ncbi:reverse transcriptase domain-containing protein [Tanacetum coccineum]
MGCLYPCVQKVGGITVVTNENDELVPTRTITGWRVCIDYRKLNEATAKDHFPLPFMDQMLERLVGNKYFCFLDGFSRYFQIPIDPNDQEKTTFTCPFGTYAYRRMPFGLCNAPATFQRCMLAIFHDMIEESVEVFMDDFSVFGNSFDTCLNNLDKMLQRCKDAHLVLNWEKCHFMVKEGIVLGHKVSSAGLEVDKAKIDVISKLPPPTNIKGVRSFLGHAGFYRRFIKDFSKIARPITKLLEKDTPFEFDDECQKAFESLKEKLTCAPVIVSLNWNLPFELICDASDFAVRAILGQKDEIKDRKGTKNVAADHLSRLENNETSDDSEVNDNFLGETLMEINTKDEPWALKRILEKTVKDNPAIWSRKLDDALWDFRTAYKTPTGTTPYKLIYGKNCHLPFEIEHRAYWALKNCNPDLIVVGEKRMFQLHELDEFRYQAYENSHLYKERTKVKNNREAHECYLNHTMEQATILREVVEKAKSRNPFDSASYSACMYVKLIQELLGYVRDTCPDIHKPNNTPKASNRPLLSSTLLLVLADQSLQVIPRMIGFYEHNEKNKVEVQSRKVKSSLNKRNFDSKNVCNEHVKHPVKGAQDLCSVCNECLFDSNHAMCLIDHVNSMNVRARSASKKNKRENNGNLQEKCLTLLDINGNPLEGLSP